MSIANRLTVFLIFTVCMLPLLSCTQQPDNAIRFGLSSMPVTLDPRFATDAASARIDRLIYQRLVDFDAQSLPVPSLASWEKLSAMHYRFSLNEDGRTFSDGMQLQAADVKATYDSILDKDTASPHRISLAMIDRIVEIDDRKIDFYLNKPDVLFPGRLNIGILPRTLIENHHAFNHDPVGSGPYEFISWRDGNHLTLNRRQDGQRLEFVLVKDPTVRVLKLLRGEIDMLQNDLPKELIAYLKDKQDIKIITGPGSNFAYLGFNMEDDLVGQFKLRKAIAHALNRDEIIKYVFGEAARPASALLPPYHWAGNKDLALIPHNPELARKLVQELDGNGKNPIRIVYKTSSDPFRLRLATIMQQQLAEVGIQVELRSYDWGTFYGDIKAGNFQMYSLMWVGIKMPDIFRYVFHSSAIPPEGANRGRFISEVADKLIETAEAGDTTSDQARSYRELQSYLLDQLPYVPLWYEDHVFVARKDITGYQIAPDGNYDGLIHIQRQ